jgi:ribosomal protein S18 acetylase RimI-like enzyme
MAVYEHFRKKGIGTKLLDTMIKSLTESGYKQISLSVDRINYAYDLYKKTGFRDYEAVGESMTMVLKLQ